MGIFDKVKRVVKSNINQIIHKAESPEKMLNQLVMDMNTQLVNSKRSVATAIADAKRLERRVQEQRHKADDWEKRALLALRASEREPERREYYEDLAKQALNQKRECDLAADKYQEQVVAQRDSVEQLKAALLELQRRFEDAQRKKNLLIARARRAEAHKKIQEQISGLSDTSAFEVFDNMADRVERIEDETKAIDEMTTPGSSGLERKFFLLEKGNSDKKMLEGLKKERASGKIEASKSGESDHENSDPALDPELDVMMEELKKKLVD